MTPPTTPSLPAWLTTMPIAHRGLHASDVPENSLAAFAAAADSGYAIELDVYQIADGSVVVFHDRTLDRMTGRPGAIVDQDAASLRAVRLAGTDETIPLLRDALRAIDGRAPFLVEIKCEGNMADDAAERVVNATLAVLDGYAGPFALQSFHPGAVRAAKARAPHIVCGALASNDAQLAAMADYDFAAVLSYVLPSPATTVLRERGVPLIAWTIRTPAQLSQARAHADNIIFEGFRP